MENHLKHRLVTLQAMFRSSNDIEERSHILDEFNSLSRGTPPEILDMWLK